MSAWTWVLVGLSAAGVVLAVSSVIAVVLQALRLRSKVAAVRTRPVFHSLESLQLQGSRLSRLAPTVQPLAQRAQVAISSIQESAQILSLPQARVSLERTGDDVRALIADLR